MSRRFVSVWLRYWPTERRRADRIRAARPLSVPFALVAPVSGGVRISAVDPLAAAEGIQPGMTLADARALLPSLTVANADPTGDAKSLAAFVDWCGRYTPFTSGDGADGAILDITGCAHLFGGEEKLLDDLHIRLRRMGLTAGIAAADTPGAAWAWARYGKGMTLPEGKARDWLAPLPVAALRLPAETVERLQELGLRHIGDLYRLPRGPLAKRCGIHLLERLDRVLGSAPEPISPVRPAPEWRSRMAFPEPIGRAEDIAEATRRLLDQLCALLEKNARGIRQLALVLYRVDGTTQRRCIGTGRPSRDTRHLFRLFTEKLAQAEAGFGIEAISLEATATDRLSADQMGMTGQRTPEDTLAPLIDRLRNRLGDGGVYRIAPVASHIPERAVTIRPATDDLNSDGWIADQARPIRLLACPEPIDATAPTPDDPPVRFIWRRLDHRVRRADGPERIAPEWWRWDASRTFRDYYRLEDEDGRRFWVFRDSTRGPGTATAWYMHGLFA